jgi:hypothetical protein
VILAEHKSHFSGGGEIHIINPFSEEENYLREIIEPVLKLSNIFLGNKMIAAISGSIVERKE